MDQSYGLNASTLQVSLLIVSRRLCSFVNHLQHSFDFLLLIKLETYDSDANLSAQRFSFSAASFAARSALSLPLILAALFGESIACVKQA